MENPFQSIQAIQTLLHNNGILTIVIGGIAVSVWGEPRLTRDIDMKIHANRGDTDRLLDLLSSDYTSLLTDPRQALRKQAMLFLQDRSGTRLDLLLADTPYDVIAIQRGRQVEVQPGLSLRMCTPEDLILYKLISTRQRDYDDVRGVIRRQDNNLDDAYILDWLRQFEQALDDSTLVNGYLTMRGHR